VAKWVEAASYSLATHPDPALAALLDEVVSLIVSAQQPDGYVNTHYTTVEPEQRWSNLRDCHELYCAGHLIEAAVAHFQATGQRHFLDCMCRYADHIATVFGPEPGQKRGYCGHEEIELALVKLYHVTGEARYLRLSQYFVDERGRQPHYYDMEAAVSLNLPLQAIKEITFEFRNLAAAQARHVDVVPLGAAFVEVFLALHVHEIEFVNQPVSLEQSERAVNRDPVNLRVQPAGAPQQLAGIEVLLGGFHHTENGAALARHAQPPRHQFRLEASRDLGFR
jgi:hypothetical protein